jgi:hypothetical protein
MADMDVDPPVTVKKEGKEKEGKQRFEVKKVCILRRSESLGILTWSLPVERRFAVGMG